MLLNKGIAEFGLRILGISLIFAMGGLAVDWVTDVEWGFTESPNTEICYEVEHRGLWPWDTRTLNPVDDSFCEAD